MIPYGCHFIDEDDISDVVAVLRSGNLTMGPKIEEFELALARTVGAKYAVVVNNGTSALHLAYLAGGIARGDEVITTPNTFVATTNMIIACGGKPVFCDIRKDNWNIDETKIEKLITEKTKAVVPVHFGGHPCEMDTIWNIAKKHGLMIIEDAAHALGSRYRNLPIGGGKSDMVTFSFHPVKPITTGEGGAVVTDNSEYYEKMKLLRSHGVIKDKNGFNVMKELGFNYRLTDVQSALGLNQLKKLERFMDTRHALVRMYEEKLGAVRKIVLPRELPGITSSWHIYVIRVVNPADRMPLYKHLIRNGVGVNFHYPAVYSHPFYKKRGYTSLSSGMREMSLYEKSAITLPLHVRLRAKDVQFISAVIIKYFDRHER